MLSEAILTDTEVPLLMRRYVEEMARSSSALRSARLSVTGMGDLVKGGGVD